MKKATRVFIVLAIVLTYSIGRSNAACNHITIDCGDGTGTIIDVCDQDDISTEEIMDFAYEYCS